MYIPSFSDINTNEATAILQPTHFQAAAWIFGSSESLCIEAVQSFLQHLPSYSKTKCKAEQFSNEQTISQYFWTQIGKP